MDEQVRAPLARWSALCFRAQIATIEFLKGA
jgi:hypothetical protein